MVDVISTSLQVTAGNPFTVRLRATHDIQDIQKLVVLHTADIPVNSSVEFDYLYDNIIYGQFSWTPSLSRSHPRSYNIRYWYSIHASHLYVDEI